MNELSHIGRPGAGKERRIASARPRNMPLLLSASERGESSRRIFSGPGGRRKSLKRLETDKENPRKTGRLSWIVFEQAWPDLSEFG
jgi:hypothetical protein